MSIIYSNLFEFVESRRKIKLAVEWKLVYVNNAREDFNLASCSCVAVVVMRSGSRYINYIVTQSIIGSNLVQLLAQWGEKNHLSNNKTWTKTDAVLFVSNAQREGCEIPGCSAKKSYARDKGKEWAAVCGWADIPYCALEETKLAWKQKASGFAWIFHKYIDCYLQPSCRVVFFYHCLRLS